MSDLTDELLRLLGDGRTIEAVRRYREATGVGLAEAKAKIDEMAAVMNGTPAAATPSTDDELTAQVVEAARTTGLIAAIKGYREATGVGLKEAKDAVEAICRSRGIVPAQGSGGGMAVVLAGMVVVLAAAIIGAVLVFAK
jgi:ribosomal protein L7/L12